MRVLVCGGRDYKNRSRVFEALDRLMAEHGTLTIIEGGAVGADTFAGEWTCTQRSCQLVTEHANWEKYGRPAGPISNQKMIDDHKPNSGGCVSRRSRHCRHGSQGPGRRH